jgi:phosphopantothenoylcysteine decarboxylase/phosphopantothenate--cysteine ligase
VLVSVGGTEEDIDPVRIISNRSSGKMGFAVAEAARDLGADVTVIAARTSVAPPHGVRVVRVRTSSEMSRALHDAMDQAEVLVMTAAISDFKPAMPLAHKKKSADQWSLELVRTDDVLASLASNKGDRVIVGFALETENEEANARAKLTKKQCDLIVLNRPEVSFGLDTNEVRIFDSNGEVYTSTAPESKCEVARKLLNLAAPHLPR